jgi:hypothetical protein
MVRVAARNHSSWREKIVSDLTVIQLPVRRASCRMGQSLDRVRADLHVIRNADGGLSVTISQGAIANMLARRQTVRGPRRENRRHRARQRGDRQRRDERAGEWKDVVQWTFGCATAALWGHSLYGGPLRRWCCASMRRASSTITGRIAAPHIIPA